MPVSNIAAGNTVKASDFRSASGAPGTFQEPADIFLSHYGAFDSDFTLCPLFYSDRLAHFTITTAFTTFIIRISGENVSASRLVTSDWADADAIRSAVLIGDNLYVLLVDTGTNPDTYRVYKYDLTAISGTTMPAGSLITFSGAVVLATTNSGMRMSSDGVSIYFNFQAGNSANDYAIAKYTVSGTTFTYVSTTSCGATAARFGLFGVKLNGEYIGIDVAVQDNITFRRYNTSGTLQTTSFVYIGIRSYIYIIGNSVYMGGYTLAGMETSVNYNQYHFTKVAIP